MELKAEQVLEVMQEKDIDTLYYANSVRTSCSFLRESALLSRGTVEQRGLIQSEQYSDPVDKKYGVWFDVFLDSCDIHERVNNTNDYGPVLFVFDVAVLDKDDMPPLWVTKKNPTDWRASDTQADRWFTSIDELREGFNKHTFAHMLVLRHVGGVLPLKGSLKKIVLEDPSREVIKGLDAYSFSRGALRASAIFSDVMKAKIEKRKCGRGCGCKGAYENHDGDQMKKFFGLI